MADTSKDTGLIQVLGWPTLIVLSADHGQREVPGHLHEQRIRKAIPLGIHFYAVTKSRTWAQRKRDWI
ncbi:MAG: hypothetical protein OES09_11145 [Gammaproteobacteria bacterium]|nr:hypothetical protein [Gammaproteobacteria bacterium]